MSGTAMGGIGLTHADGKRVKGQRKIEALRIQDVRERVVDALASEILMERYAEEGKKYAEEQLHEMGPRAVQLVVATLAQYPQMKIQEVVKAVRTRNAQLLKGEPLNGREEVGKAVEEGPEDVSQRDLGEEPDDSRSEI